MTVKFEVFPDKFGAEDKTEDLEIWISSFEEAVEFNGCTEEDSLKFFRLWLKGKAARWHMEMIPESNRSNWTLKDWTKELKKKFMAKGNVIGLTKLEKKPEQTWDTFGNQFTRYVETIPEDLVTEKWITKTFLEAVSVADLNLWRELYLKCRNLKLSEVIRKVVATAKCWDEGLKDTNKNSGDTGRGNFTVSVNNQQDADSSGSNDKEDIVELTKMVKELSLAVLNRPIRKSRDELECYSCHQKGHTSRYCPQRTGVSLGKEKLGVSESPALIALEDHSLGNEGLSCAADNVRNKRIRVEDLLEDRPVVLPRLSDKRKGEIKKNIKKRVRTKPKPSGLATKILQNPAPITIGELLRLKPQFAGELISSVRDLKSKNRQGLLYAENRGTKEFYHSEENPTFIMSECRGVALPLLIDTGATHSLIKMDLVNQLEIKPYLLKNSIRIQPVYGKSVEISMGCTLELQLEERS
ncbi:hypothetical protein AYI69_g9263, partial [Smittium culicis]